MAATTTIKDGIITVVSDGSSEWSLVTALPQFEQTGIRLKGIKFFGSAANDILVVRSGSATGPIISKMKDVTPAGVADAFGDKGMWCKPYIKYADQTYNTAASTLVMFEYAGP